jgi:hypothetical protein
MISCKIPDLIAPFFHHSHPFSLQSWKFEFWHPLTRLKVPANKKPTSGTAQRTQGIMASHDINPSLTSTPPPASDTSDPHSHLAHPNTSQNSSMSAFDNTTCLSEEEYYARLHSTFMYSDPPTPHDAKFSDQQSLPPTSSMPTSSIDPVSSVSFRPRCLIQASIFSILDVWHDQR